MRRFPTLLLLLIATQIHAASEHPPQYRWRTITTDHFYVHFHQGEEELARRAAGYAESAHVRLVPMLGWTPRERTHIILTDHVDELNGQASQFPINRIEVFVTAPGADPSSPIGYYDNWLNQAITHEYTHILHLDQARGFSAGIRKVFGRTLLLGFPNEWSPRWFIEGIATLTETEETGGGRLKGTYVDMVLRAAAVENRWPTEAQAGGLGPYWPAGNAPYYYGSKFLSWLATTHGMARLTRFMNEYSSNVVPFRINATAEHVYGTSMKELWQQWSEEQQKVYLAERDRLAADGLTQKQRLTTTGYETKHPTLSPDGTRIAYTHRGPFERATIRVRDVISGRDIATRSINTTSPLSWSPDGRSIAYSDLEFAGSFALLSDLYIWDLDHGVRRITKGARLKGPSFAPNGRALIAVENRLGRNRLVEVDIVSGAIKPLVEPIDDRQFDEPAVSPDGNMIAVAEWQNGAVDITLYSRDGQRVRNLTESFKGATNGSPRFSPDGRTIWFSSDVTGVPNIFSMSTEGGDIRRMSNVYGGALYPTPAGRKMFYSDYSSDGFDLASFDLAKEFPVVPRVIPATVTGQQQIPRTEDRGPRTGASTEGEYSPWRSIRPRWWSPIIDSATVNDKSKPLFGFTTSGGDVLARHTYDAAITNRSYGVIYNYDRFYPTLTLAAARYDDDLLGAKHTETTNRIVAQVAVPWRKVQWQLVGSAGAIRDHIGGDIPAGIFRGTLQGVRLGAFFSNAHEYLFSISPERGVTATVNYENVSGENASLQQIRADVRGYLTIPYAPSPLGRHVLAMRAAGARNSGDFIFQRQLKVGGDSTGVLMTLDLNEFPVRGFDTSTLRGQSAAIGSVEYRFPIYEIERGPTTWPVFFNRIHGDVFSDAGRAGGQTIASAGAEVAADFILGNVLPIRYRAGVAVRLTNPGKRDVQPYVGFGSSF